MVRLSVVVPTFNRRALLERLIGQLARQTLAPESFEVVVVDDGSREPPRPAGGCPFSLRIERQGNRGAASARHRGALLARGPLLVFLDDDMQVGPEFLSAHLSAHRGRVRRVVLGRMRPDPALGAMPLFERWHARLLDRLAVEVRRGRTALRGNHLFSGNVSLGKHDYLAAGGFDPSLRHSEDVELGLRLEKLGVRFVLCERAFSLHGSDHRDLAWWRRRAFLYGRFDRRIGRKHPDLPNASPFRLFREMSLAASPALLFALLAPGPAAELSRLATAVCGRLDSAGLTRPALAGMSVAFGVEYYRGVRAEAGSARAALGEAFRREERES